MKKTPIALLVLAALQANAHEDNSHDIEKVTVSGRQVSLVGEAISASQGVVGQEEIQLRPILRTGEILEFIPGMVVTQHSGTVRLLETKKEMTRNVEPLPSPKNRTIS